MTKDPARSKRIPQLDGLRGVAILLVLSLHFINDSNHGAFGTVLYRVGSAFRLGWSGVDLFFVLSGFLIGGILLEARDAENYFKVFYARRFHRIIPIYYLWLSLLVGLLFFAEQWVSRIMPTGVSAFHLIPFYYLFLQNYLTAPFGSFLWIWLAPAWSLGVEEQFYLLMPPLIRFLSTARLKTVLLLTIAVSPALRVLIFFLVRGNQGAICTWTICRADSLAVGVLAALLWQQGTFQRWYELHHRSFKAALLFLLAGIPVFTKWLASPYSLFMAAVGFSWLAFLFVGLLLFSLAEPAGKFSAILQSRILGEFGKLSYCVYLIHLAILHLAHRLLLHDLPRIHDAAGAGVTLLALVVTLILAQCSWRILESPLVHRGHKFVYSRTSDAPALSGVPEAPVAL